MQTGDIQRAKNIVINALEQQYESEQLLQSLKSKDIFINRNSLAQQANDAIDTRDQLQRKVEDNIGSLTPDLRKEIFERHLQANPNDKFAKDLLNHIRRIDNR